MNQTELHELRQLANAYVAREIIDQGTAAMAGGDRRATVHRLAAEAIDQESTRMVQGAMSTPTADEEARIIAYVIAEQLGIGQLQTLLDDDSIEDIDINGFDCVFATYADGTKARLEPVCASDEELIELIQRIARVHHTGGERRVDSSKPTVDVRLAGGHRMSAMIEVSNRPCISIRRHRLPDPTLADLSEALTPELELFLNAAVTAGLNIIVCGGTSAGKTTLLRALAACLDPEVRIITVELAFELGFHELAARHADVTAWEAREANTEGEGDISMEYLVRRANRHHPDRIIVGEVLGDEIVPMLNSMTAGHPGMCTIHCDSSEGVFAKIATYASQASKSLSDTATARLTAQALDLVIFVRRGRGADGRTSRYVSSVRVVEDCIDTSVISSEIFAEPPGGGPAVPHMGIPPALRERLYEVGYEAPAQVYGR